MDESSDEEGPSSTHLPTHPPTYPLSLPAWMNKGGVSHGRVQRRGR